MLTRIQIKNFKRFDNVDIELGNAVVLIGPNNSGKTTALQALALWDIGLKRWNEKRQGKGSSEKRPGVAINRRDIISVPVPNASLFFLQTSCTCAKAFPPNPWPLPHPGRSGELRDNHLCHNDRKEIN